MKFILPQLPYSYDAFEPFIDARTMEIHHTKHHQGYVDKLNAALEKHPDYALSLRGPEGRGNPDVIASDQGERGNPEIDALEKILSDLGAVPEDVRIAVRNNGGGHYNHSLFWGWMAPPSPSLRAKRSNPVVSAPSEIFSGDMLDAINASFGSVEKLKEEFGAAAAGIFGSGWAWVVIANREAQSAKRGVVSEESPTSKKLVIVTTPNQDSPISQGLRPILGLDVWEHAYYIKYQNRRPEYIEAWWNVVNWERIELLYTSHVARST